MALAKQVTLLIETSNAYARGLLRGVMAYARERDRWSVRLSERGRGEVQRSELSGWDGDGVIARIENPRVADAVRRFGGPVIDVSAARLVPDLPWVETDDRAIARAAADHLIGLGLRHFGYCGDDRFNWSRWRRDAFHGCVAAAGFACSDGPARPSRSGADLVRWVAALPRPAGVFAGYDVRGRDVIDACRRAGAAVPDEVAVVGVDDDDLLCELCDPPLTSVAPDAYRTGRVAAELLDRWMGGEAVPAAAHPIPPLGVTTRRSTDTLAVEDPDVAAAVRYIRAHATDGISVRNVVARVPLSRRVLEDRFQRLIGRSPHAEIVRVRLGRACELLAQPGWTLDAVARRTGFRHGEYLSVVFKRELGMNPGEYRDRCRR